ncbi:phage NrS-1 polymerase family protein [Halobaculum roseum]|uniref:NrS-1 polymerase-like HBD domain-containing protein n=1 Tax=Halobaculum roseum TaxID=2175149 RepID=A0ABD5MP11_9EURY|nr:hypothetical protein [Halobaculum roseum]QZY01946.1 hypothetical protein K6T36_11580 [Halobaculum roseum]
MTDPPVPTADRLPETLTDRDQWVCWRSEQRDDKSTKVPIEPGGGYASATDPDTWRSLSVARDHAVDTGDAGVGFVFTDDDPLVGVDLDDCRDPDTGALSESADDIVEQLNSYTEVSPSGTGIHVIVAGDLPRGRNRRGDVELYDSARYFTVTGDRVDGTPDHVAERPEALAAVHSAYVAPDTSAASTSGSDAAASSASRSGKQGPGNRLSDADLIDRASDAANGPKFRRLWRGSTAGYPSHSEADMALCSLLAFWTGGDPDQMDRLFRESGLYREKWDEVHFSDGATYGERTIERAIARTDEYYDESSSEGWTPLAVTSAEDRASEQAAGSGDEGSVADTTGDALADLRAELAKLEQETERLREELAVERTRRKELERELAQQESSRLSRYLPWR